MLTRAAARGSTHPLVIADLPFMSYQVDDRDAMVTAGRFIKEGGADAVKMEGAGPTLDRILAVTRAGIPVMGHLGLTPQTATALGGFKAQGRTAHAALQLLDDALAIEAAGAFARRARVRARRRSRRPSRSGSQIPTIGIGAGAGCDGQVLVYHDLLGYGEARAPRFVKRYADLHGAALDGRQAATRRRCGRARFRRSSTRTRCRPRSWPSSRTRWCRRTRCSTDAGARPRLAVSHCPAGGLRRRDRDHVTRPG